jgi:hypothetical protein
MKKLLVAFIAVAFVFGIIAQSAIAEDRLSMSGAMRVRAWNKNNYEDFDSDTKTDEDSFFDQRFRLQSIITPADGVKAVLRCDFAENVWGSDNWSTLRYSEADDHTAELQVDRAYLDVTKGILNVRAGQFWQPLGDGNAYANQQTGLAFTFNTPVKIMAIWFKESEGGDTTDADEEDQADPNTDPSTQDVDQYVLDLAYATDTFSIEGFYAAQVDSQSDEDTESNSDATTNATLFGIFVKAAAGPLNIKAEIDSFGGSMDTGAAETDLMGLQFIGDVSMALNDQVTLGGNLVYSNAEDEDADEEKITKFPNAGIFPTVYTDYGAFNTDIEPLKVSSATGGDIFSPLASDNGVWGAGIYGKFNPMETVTIWGQIMYLVGLEEFDNTDGEFDNGTIFNVSAQWAFTQNAHVALGYNYTAVSLKDDVDTDPAQALAARIQIDF